MKITNSDKTLKDSGEIQETGNILLDNVLEDIRKKFTDKKIVKTNEEHQKDRGVDFQIELVGRKKDDTLDMLKLQVKATEEPLVPLKTTVNKGLISFQLSNRHIRYYQQEMPWALIILLCDNTNQKIYWYAIQLDDDLDERVQASKVKKQDTIQIYFDPKNLFNAENFGRFLRDAEESATTQYFKVREERSGDLSADSEFEVDKTQPLLDQLYSLLDYLYDEIRYLPVHLLSQYYPFKVAGGHSLYYGQFKLYSENEDLVNMLESFQVQPDGTIKFTDLNYIKGVKNYAKKAKAVLQTLSSNHIYWLVSEKTRKEVPLRYFTHGDCDCVACTYSRMDLPGTIGLLQNPKDKTLDEKMKTAYMHYELGNYLRAAKDFQQIGKLARKQRKKTLFLITQFNLAKLGKLIKNNYYDAETSNWGKALMDTSLERAVYSAPNRTHHRKLFNHIKEVRFYVDTSLEIQTALNKLRKEYYSFINGGSFSTHSYDELVNGFAQLSSFISSNRIVYDRFLEFSLQIDEFTEGIFIALALKETNSYVISGFIDYHIHRLIFDGDHQVIWRFFNKYNHKFIPYKPEGEGKFYPMIQNLLANHHLVKDAYQVYAPDEGSFWRNRYREVFANTICLAAMIQMDDEKAEMIARAIMDCYSKSDLPSPEAYSQVNSFLSGKRAQFKTVLIEEMIAFYLNYKDMYLEKRLGIFAAELKTRKVPLMLDTRQTKQLMEYSFGDQEQLRFFNTLTSIYPACSPKLQDVIVGRVTVQLRKKFDTYHYYHAVIMGVLEFQNSEFFGQFISRTYPDPSKFSFHNTFYGRQDNAYPLFDQFFNLCFKFSLDPQTLTDKPLIGFGEYYDWLLDIDGYDYHKFKISWIGLYPTKFYLERFSRHLVLRKQIEKHLKHNRDLKTERLYFDIYVPKEEDAEPDYE